MQPAEQRSRNEIISLGIDNISYRSAIKVIIEKAKSKEPAYVCFANVHMTIEAHYNKNFAQDVNNAFLVLADGVPIVKALDLLYGLKQDRVAGMDVMPSLLYAAALYELKVFFFGTTQDILEKIRARLQTDYPNLEVVGKFSPPFNSDLDDERYINMINTSNPHLVFVALGCPKQESWMARNSPKINAVLLGVGGAFPVYAGLQKRAPRFIRRIGLEWLFRLSQEPQRLLKRYMSSNTIFVYLLAKEYMQRSGKKAIN
jgi:N-acetylglucosaminyldiphosphoundecaprenol N-acetyl-beta-D-mannosaminyltransferase